MKIKLDKLISNNFEILFKDFSKISDEGVTFILGKRKCCQIFGDLQHVYFKKDQMFYPIERFRSKVELWIDFIQSDYPDTQRYKSIETGETYANILTRQISMNDNKMGLFNIIQIEGEDNYKYSLITGDEDIEQRIDLVELATVSNVELKIIRNE